MTVSQDPFDPKGFPGFSRTDLDRFVFFYRRALGRPGTGAVRVGWGSDKTQEKRFEVFSRLAPLSGSSVLDVGCGLGAFASFLSRKRMGVRYRGVDLFEPLIREARWRNPRGRFFVRNLILHPFPPRSFDYVFASGVFNLKVWDNHKYLKALVGSCWRMARHGLAFNVLHGSGGLRARDRFLADPGYVAAFCRRLSGAARVRMVGGYHPHDLTFFIERKIGP